MPAQQKPYGGGERAGIDEQPLDVTVKAVGRTEVEHNDLSHVAVRRTRAARLPRTVVLAGRESVSA